MRVLIIDIFGFLQAKFNFADSKCGRCEGDRPLWIHAQDLESLPFLSIFFFANNTFLPSRSLGLLLAASTS